jgi:hypothetical protein
MGQMIFVANGGGGGGSTCPRRSVVWQPGGVSSCDTFSTWAEVETQIAASQGLINIFVDCSIVNPAVIPSTADTECFGRVSISTATFNIGAGGQIVIADGGRLKNLSTVRGMPISGSPTIRPFIQQNIAGTVLICREGGNITLDIGATVPAVELTATFCEIAAFEGASYGNNTGNPALAAIAVGSGFTCLHAVISQAGSSGPNSYPANLFSGDGTTTLIQIYDSSAEPVPQPNFLGGLVALPMSYGSGTVYNDSTVPVPSLGVNTVQAAIDVLKVQVAALVPGSYRASFTDADLVLGVLTVVHGLGVNYNTYAIWDNLNFSVLNPDSVLNVDGNTMAIDLSTYQIANGGAIPGTWNVVVQS